MARKKRKPPIEKKPAAEVSKGDEARLTPELRAWALRQVTKEEIVAGLRELKEKGGLELHEFLQELEQILARP